MIPCYLELWKDNMSPKSSHMSHKRILVCGGRKYDNKKKLEKILDLELSFQPLIIICGMERGADRLAYNWSVDREQPCFGFPAQWKRFGKKAGFMRNQQMLDIGKPDFAYVFPGGEGTADMLERIKTSKIPYEQVEN